jgi:anti-sigma B factor antagonist
MVLQAKAREVAGRPVLELTGSVDIATVPALHNALGRVLVEHAGATVVVDLDAVDGLDDVGLGVLLGAAGRARRAGGDLVVVCSDDVMRERLAVTGFDRAVIIERSLSA